MGVLRQSPTPKKKAPICIIKALCGVLCHGVVSFTKKGFSGSLWGVLGVIIRFPSH